MANRFYQTTEGRFVDKNMYQAPWELMQVAINTHEERTDKLVAETDLLSGAVDTVQHLDFSAENERVKALQDKYGTMIDDLTTKITDNPLEYEKHLPSLKKAQRDLLQDKTSGEWADVENRYKAFTKWKEDNKEMKTEEPGTYNKLEKHWHEDIVKRATEDSSAQFKGQQGVSNPDFVKTYQKLFQDIKANATPTSDGKYIYQNELVSEQEVAQIAWNLMSSDPNYAAYAQQQGNLLGQAGYFDKDGKTIQPFYWVNGKGQRVPFSAIKNMTPEEQKKVQKVLNPEHAGYAELQAVSSIYSFQDTEIKADEFAKINASGGVQSKLQQQKAGDAVRLEGYKQQGRVEIQNLKNQAGLDKLQKAYDLEKGIATEEGDFTTLDNLSIAMSPYQVVTIDKQKEIGKDYTELHAKVIGGSINTLSPKDQIKYNQLQGLYENVAREHGDALLQAAGEDPSIYGKDNLGTKQKEARVSKILAEILQLSDPDFGVKITQGTTASAGGLRRNTERDGTERNNTLRVKKAFTEAVGDFDETISKSMVVTRGSMPVGKGNPIAEVGIALVNTLWQSGVEPIIQDINQLSYDINDKERGSKRVDVDTSVWSAGKTSDPLGDIMEQAGVANPQQLQAKGFGRFKWRQERGDIVVDFIPNKTALKAAGVNVTDRNFPEKGFSMRHKNLTGNVWDNFKGIEGMDNATLEQIKLQSDVTYGEVAQKVDQNVGMLKSPGRESYPFVVGGIPDTMFKLEYNDKTQKYQLMQTFAEGDQEGTWDDLRQNKIYQQHSDPQVLKLRLVEMVKEAHQNK
tara:strand:+ start:4804 stop:7194 length:2391 start_codon:yes stop_codon:yes gene_type:complete